MSTNEKFYENKWFIILMLIFIAPVGIWLVITKTKLSKLSKIIITIIFGIWTLCGISIYLQKTQPTTVNSVQASSVAQAGKVDDKTANTDKAANQTTDDKAVQNDTKPAVTTPQEVQKTEQTANTQKEEAKAQPVENKQESSNNDENNSSSGNTGIIKTLGTGRHHARLHSAPSAHSSGYDLSGGTVVKILGETGEYYHVQLQDGSTGYVYEHYVSCN